jgi:hypothetical protein
MRKGITLLTVLLLPITIYLIFAISTIHYVPVPHYGPRSTRSIVEQGRSHTDTVYHTIGSFVYKGNNGLVKSDTLRNRMYLALFIQTDSLKNNYNCAALKAYANFNKEDLDTLHFVFFYPLLKDSLKPTVDLADTLKFKKNHCLTFFIDGNDKDYLCREYYFKSRPGEKKAPWKSYQDLVLIDTKGCVRGYYDARYAPEISRMVEDIKHIKFHDEAASMEKKYTPVKKGT